MPAVMLLSEVQSFAVQGDTWWAWTASALLDCLLVLAFGWSVVRWVRFLRSEVKAHAAKATAADDRQGAVAAADADDKARMDAAWKNGLGAATGLIAFTLLMFCVILNEGPVRVEVGDDALVLRYRLPWRDEMMHARSIDDVQLLHRSRSRRTLASTWPVLVITRHGKRLEIMAEHAKLEPAVEQAYEAARRMVERKAEADRASR